MAVTVRKFTERQIIMSTKSGQCSQISSLGGSIEHLSVFVASDGQILSYKRAGNGRNKVIFLHDWSVSVDGDYAFAAPFFNGDSLEVVFADLRGYGGSYDLRGDYTAEEICDDVCALADELGWDKFNIVGHSMTGLVVQKIMADLPDRVIKAVAAVPVPATGTQPDDATLQFLETVPFKDDAFRTAMTTLTSEMYGEAWLNFKLIQNRRSVRPDAMKSYVKMFARSNYSREVSGCVTPFLVIFGSYDSLTLREETTGAIFARMFPNLTTKKLTAGHYPMVEAPVAYAKTVEEFLLS